MSPQRRERLLRHTVRPLAALGGLAVVVATGVVLFTLATDVALA